MKKSVVFLVIAVVFEIGFLAGSKIYAKLDLPRITNICEDKSGNLFSINDGFSKIDEVPNNARQVGIIGEKGDRGDPGPKGDKGEPGIQGLPGDNTERITYPENIAFIYWSGDPGRPIVLTNENVIYKNDGYGWVQLTDTRSPLSSPVPIDKIVQWRFRSLFDKDGNFWLWNYQTYVWMNLGHP